MNLILVLGILVWLLIMFAGPIVVYLNAPKPFSTLQKVGMLVSVVALIAVFVLPVVSDGGVLNFNFADTLSWIGGRSNHDLVMLCEYFVPIFLAWFVFAPIISTTLYMGNVGKRIAGLLLIVPPLYLAVLGNFSSFLKQTGLASGSIIYLLCGIALIALPWFIKGGEKQPQAKKRLMAIMVAIVAIVGFAPAIALQVTAKSDEQKNEQRNKEFLEEVAERNARGEAEVAALEEVVEDENISEIEEERGGNAMPTAPQDACFIQGLSNIARYTPHWIEPEDPNMVSEYSKAVIPQIYMYASKRNFFIRAGKRNGSFALTLSGESVSDWSLDLGDLFDVIDIDGSTEFFFGQSDIDGDGVDELIVAGRTIQEGGNRICVNVYNMSGEADIPVKSVHNKTTYNAMGIAFVEPSSGERSGYIEIGEGETMKHKETWVLQDNFQWDKLEY